MPFSSKKSPVELRLKQIERRIENLQEQLVTKTQKHFKTENLYKSWHLKTVETIAELERESMMLKFPEDYEELPLAAAAEELGVRTRVVHHLIAYDEIVISSMSEFTNQCFISREEIGRVQDEGIEKLMQRADLSSEEIFEKAVKHLSAGQITEAEDAYDQLILRDGEYGAKADALKTTLSLLKGDLSDALSRVKAKFNYYRGQEEITVFFSYITRLLKNVEPEDFGSKALREQILLIIEKKETNLYRRYENYRPKKSGKQLDSLQQRAMYLAASVFRSLKKYRYVQQFKSYHPRNSQMREDEFENVLRDAIYTALTAEATYNESASSKIFVDTLRSEIPRWYGEAELIEHIGSVNKEAESLPGSESSESSRNKS